MSSISITFEQRYDDACANTLGKTEEEVREAYPVIYSTWRSEDAPPTIEELENEILTDFISPIGAIRVMLATEGSKTGRFKLTHDHSPWTSISG
jgi:hypothetical protein